MTQWKQTRDRGSPWLIDLIIWIILNLGRQAGRALLYPIVFYFVLTSSTRRYSYRYLQRNFQSNRQKSSNPPEKPGIIDVFRHYYSFSNMLLDRVYFLTGKTQRFNIRLHHEEQLQYYLQQNQGIVLLGSHLGNFDALRALAQQQDNIKIRALMYNNEQQNINKAFEKLNPTLKKDVIYVGTPDAMLNVQRDLEQGYIIGMLADRIEQEERSLLCPFLGQPAAFPTGPFIVAHLLKAPVFVCFALHRDKNNYDVYFHLLSPQIHLSRQHRQRDLQGYVEDYARLLQDYAWQYPYNWYNFYDFWNDFH